MFYFVFLFFNTNGLSAAEKRLKQIKQESKGKSKRNVDTYKLLFEFRSLVRWFAIYNCWRNNNK